MNHELDNKKIAVIGLGLSNLSVITYLLKHDLSKLSVFDTRVNPPNLDKLPVGIDVHLGPLDGEELKRFDIIVISPGISIYSKEIAEARQCGCKITGDIELFAHELKAPAVGITGSNGKSTATTLLGYMADKAGIRVAIGANIGIPVFEILDDSIELYVLELSSFELETVSSLKLKAGTILNVSEDHLDRYHGSIDEYAKTKQRIFANCENIVENRDDPRTFCPEELKGGKNILTFGQSNQDYGLTTEDGTTWITVNGEKIISQSEILIKGKHNLLNAAACMALADAVGIPRKAQLEALKAFSGLPHRCQVVKEIAKVTYYNDSKATNVASTEAAINSLSSLHPNGIILLAGGMGKGQDFSPLKRYIGKEVSEVFCFGKDADKIKALSESRCHLVVNLRQALHEAYRIAKPGQAVLLSPACASFDQFKGFENRGLVFVNMVAHLTDDSAEDQA